MNDLHRKELHGLALLWTDAWQGGQHQEVLDAMDLQRKPLRLAALVAIMVEGLDTQERHDLAQALVTRHLTDPNDTARK